MLELSDGQTLRGSGHLRHSIAYVEADSLDGEGEWKTGSQNVVLIIDDEDLLFAVQSGTGRLTIQTPCCEALGPNRWPVMVNGQQLVRTVG